MNLLKKKDFMCEIFRIRKWYLCYSENKSFLEFAYHMEKNFDMKSLKPE